MLFWFCVEIMWLAICEADLLMNNEEDGSSCSWIKSYWFYRYFFIFRPLKTVIVPVLAHKLQPEPFHSLIFLHLWLSLNGLRILAKCICVLLISEPDL